MCITYKNLLIIKNNKYFVEKEWFYSQIFNNLLHWIYYKLHLLLSTYTHYSQDL